MTRSDLARRFVVVLPLLLTLPDTAAAQKYRYPISNSHVSKTYVTAHFDYSGKDYHCGTLRYSGHRGNDYGCGSFTGMDAGRDIVAAADGTVEYVHDGEFDRCTTANCSGGGGYGNYVKLKHKDGKNTYYAHMRKGTVAVKSGQKVTCGQKLGQVGSSGYSTGPHLHFEVRSGSSRRDPYKGSCGGYGYWVSQGSYGKYAYPSTKCDGPSTPTLAATFTSQGSDGLKGSGGAYFSLCPGQSFNFWFSLTNTGTATWKDSGGSGTGEAVRLGRKSDPFGAPSEVSINKASRTSVKKGETTTFTISGKAPGKNGTLKTEWQLKNGGSWFGPAMFLTFNVTDKPPEAGAACSNGQKGVCGEGKKACQGGKIACLVVNKASAEKCDGKDNNCNGSTDEGLSQTCYTGPAASRNKGACKDGKQTCAAGKWGSCSGQVTPKNEEVCGNGKDDDCDGKVDDGCPCKAGSKQSCSKGGCQGTQSCLDGKWGPCQLAGGGKEICNNGRDDDCDGKTDEVDCVAAGDLGGLPPGVDAGNAGHGGQTLTGGCGCATANAPGGGVPWMILLLVGGWVRRRP